MHLTQTSRLNCYYHLYRTGRTVSLLMSLRGATTLPIPYATGDFFASLAMSLSALSDDSQIAPLLRNAKTRGYQGNLQ